MKRWLITRHPGAVQWFADKRYVFDQVVRHIEVEKIAPGDAVYGTLPVPLVASLCARDIEYWHLNIPMNATDRGRELSAQDLRRLGATIERFRCTRYSDDNGEQKPT